MKKSIKGILERTLAADDKPVRKRAITNDATPEKLHELLRDNPDGVLVHRDELGGWLAEMEQPGRQTERAFYLTCANGDASYSMDRIIRGSVYAPAVCCSLLFGMQPRNFRRYMKTAQLDRDGLLQRMQLLLYYETKTRSGYVDRAPDTAAQEAFSKICWAIAHFSSADPVLGRFSPEAQLLFREWWRELEEKVNGLGSSAFAEHLDKFPKLMPSLALLFELADYGCTDGFEGFEVLRGAPFRISAENTKRAIAFCAYLEQHAKRVYAMAGDASRTASELLWYKIRDRQVGDEDGLFTARDVYDRGWSGLNTAEMAKMAISGLLETHWLRDVSTRPGPHGGRPTFTYQINPRIWEADEC
jgi:hypothetical protein